MVAVYCTVRRSTWLIIYRVKLSPHQTIIFTAADTLTLSGFYRMDERADYQPLIIGFNPIRNMVITGTSRIICYNQIIYDNDRAEENEIFSLTMTVQDGSAVTTQVDSQLSSAIIIIWDDDSE